ncbi:23S rRNA (adenine(2030)-N(6))-methyltransferase RlmJ [Oceanicoccus sp. KOV_DT_Chl]|uniref:23S rRNA (adenine(2030)-N(6))-methyltransferase RlmJ n=1 Tax=Oceanicoccus sp. KOV_DT_Chl TaxID=1904639 RepID=UPI000C79D5AA|nr:23S rRNA (adenine(2030)-N(6))-methyltransferase RlmJ [Oceanicoccus sp. KOV_DT_Chl]
MLSYRHSFHAGNFADVLKHIVLVEILEHLVQKEAPFEYIDTHAGAGLFNLHSTHAKKLEEHTGGIGSLDAAQLPQLSCYFELVNGYNRGGTLKHYPGSPAFAQHFLRPQDRAWLYELHPEDYQSLRKNMQSNRKIRVEHEDGLKGMMAVVPPKSRRGLVLIDPSYEVKTEYDQVFDAINKAHKKFATGIYVLWYPVVERRQIDVLEKKFKMSGIKNIQRFELGVTADTKERGMTSSGLFVINPPWKLFDTMSAVLPVLAQQLGRSDGQFYKCDIIVEE